MVLVPVGAAVPKQIPLLFKGITARHSTLLLGKGSEPPMCHRLEGLHVGLCGATRGIGFSSEGHRQSQTCSPAQFHTPHVLIPTQELVALLVAVRLTAAGLCIRSSWCWTGTFCDTSTGSKGSTELHRIGPLGIVVSQGHLAHRAHEFLNP